MMAMRGYTQEVEDAYRHALDLAERADAPQLAPVLRSLASLHLYRAEFERGLAIGRQLLELAEAEGDRNLQVEGHLRLGTNLMSLGDAATGIEHLDRAISLFEPDAHVTTRFRLGPSPGVVSLTSSAFILWATGYPDQAVERGKRALEVADRLGHPYTQAYALFHVGFLDVWRRDWRSVTERAKAVQAVSEEHDYDVWRAVALVLQGLSAAALGDGTGIDALDRGFELYRGLTTPPVFWPLLLSVRARALAFAERPEEGHVFLDEALALPRGRPNLLHPELPMLKGDLLAMSRPEAAEPWFREAADAAEASGARMSLLRAAIRLTVSSHARGDDSQERRRLETIYDSFTEGYDSLDLVEARRLLEADGAA
jgi:tetratricopeptide (TPR) repeat protein